MEKQTDLNRIISNLNLQNSPIKKLVTNCQFRSYPEWRYKLSLSGGVVGFWYDLDNKYVYNFSKDGHLQSHERNEDKTIFEHKANEKLRSKGFREGKPQYSILYDHNLDVLTETNMLTGKSSRGWYREYNQDGKLTSETMYRSDDSTRPPINYEYDTQGNLKTEHHFYKDGRVTAKTEYTYDDKEITQLEYDTFKTEFLKEKIYYGKFGITKRVLYKRSKHSINVETENEYLYNDLGNIISISKRSPNQPRSVQKFEYLEYDTYNNWVNMKYKEYSGEEGELELGKTIDYYQTFSYWGEGNNFWKGFKSLFQRGSD